VARLTTAGRDRTGIVAGVLHSLAGTPEEDIVYDYMLTRVGLEPGRAQLEARILAHWNIADAQNEPGWSNFASLRPTFGRTFVEGVQEAYGGFEGYVTGHLGFSEGDVQTIKRNLRQEE
jgi:protein tyrosine/serine phosphatase